MAIRRIRINQIASYSEGKIRQLVSAATLQAEEKLKDRTPVDTGRLRASWQRTIKPLEGTVFNNLSYAEPVVAGQNYPASWGGQYRTRQGAEPFLDIVTKDVQTWIESNASRISAD